MKIIIPVECDNCKFVIPSVEVEVSDLTVQKTINDDEIIVSDLQRECPKCNHKWEQIHIFYNKAKMIEIAFGEEV